jgi:uncharacterized protein (DUF58 family)
MTELPPVDRQVGRAEPILRQLELAVTRRLDGLLQGDFEGLMPGAGSERGEGREYRPGDDVRRIDWNLTARTAVPHVTDTIVDRELETWVVADCSASLDFGTAGCEKRDLVLAAVAAMGFLTSRAGNRLGAVLDTVPAPVIHPPRADRAALLGLLRRLQAMPRAVAAPPPDSLATLGRTLEMTARVAKRRGLVVVASDFLDDPGTWERPLRRLSTRHDVLAVEVIDPRELSLPAVGLLTLVDPETGGLLEVQTSNPKLRARYDAAAAEQRSAIARSIRRGGAEHVQLRTDRDWVLDLVRFVRARRRRRMGAMHPTRDRAAVLTGGAVPS